MSTATLQQNSTAIMERPRPPKRIFRDPSQFRSVYEDFGKVYTRYRVHIQFLDKVVGGTPRDPNILRKWLVRRLASNDAALQLVLNDTLREAGIELSPTATEDEIAKAAKAMEFAQTTGFKFDDRGLYLEARTLKAALKEGISIGFTGERLGKREGYSGKAAKGFFNERVFVVGDTEGKCHLLAPYEDGNLHYIVEPDGIERFIGHVDTPQGPRSAISLFEYVTQPQVMVYIDVFKDAIPAEVWETVWRSVEENGWGSKRSQSFGRLKVLSFEPIGVMKESELTPYIFGDGVYDQPPAIIDQDETITWQTIV